MSSLFRTTFTDFLRDPNAVVEKLDQDDIVLHRRNAGDLRLSLQSRSEEADEGLRFFARFIGAAFADDDARHHLVGAATAIPWVSVLPATDQARFARQLITAAEAAGELGSMTPISQIITSWRTTAATYVDSAEARHPERPKTAFRGRKPVGPGA